MCSWLKKPKYLYSETKKKNLNLSTILEHINEIKWMMLNAIKNILYKYTVYYLSVQIKKIELSWIYILSAH